MTQHPLADALRDIINPLAKLRRDAEAKDREIGPMAYSIANDINFIQGIARDALAQYEKSDTDRDQLRDDLTRRLESLRQTIADNEPDTAIADNGMTVWDGVRHEVAYLFPRISAALASKTAIDPVTVERVTKAILFEDCGSTEHWEENTNLGEAAIRALGKDQ